MQPSLTQTKETDQQAGNNFANDFLTILNNKIFMYYQGQLLTSGECHKTNSGLSELNSKGHCQSL